MPVDWPVARPPALASSRMSSTAAYRCGPAAAGRAGPITQAPKRGFECRSGSDSEAEAVGGAQGSLSLRHLTRAMHSCDRTCGMG